MLSPNAVRSSAVAMAANGSNASANALSAGTPYTALIARTMSATNQASTGRVSQPSADASPLPLQRAAAASSSDNSAYATSDKKASPLTAMYSRRLPPLPDSPAPA